MNRTQVEFLQKLGSGTYIPSSHGQISILLLLPSNHSKSYLNTTARTEEVTSLFLMVIEIVSYFILFSIGPIGHVQSHTTV